MLLNKNIENTGKIVQNQPFKNSGNQPKSCNNPRRVYLRKLAKSQ